MNEYATAFDWAEYTKLKERAEKRRIQSNEHRKEQRVQKKIDEGLDPNIDRRANKREGESEEDYAKRMKTNAEKARWRREKERAKREGVWTSRRKLTPEEKKAKNAARLKAWRLAKKMGASAV